MDSMHHIEVASRAGRRTVTAFVCVMISAVLGGCAAGSYGRVQQDPEVTRMFRTNTVPEAYRYYQTGRTDLPYAIIGIAPPYRLASGDWEAITPNTEAFSRKVDFVWLPDDTWDKLEPAQGAHILDPQGNKIGIWYSSYPRTTVQVKPDHRVLIFSPFIPNK